MLEKALYKVPHESGWFDVGHENHGEGTDTEDELEEFSREGPKKAEDDDDFVKSVL